MERVFSVCQRTSNSIKSSTIQIYTKKHKKQQKSVKMLLFIFSLNKVYGYLQFAIKPGEKQKDPLLC